MKIKDLVDLIDVEEELIDVVDYNSGDNVFSFWASSFFDGELSTVEYDYINTLDVKGFHIAQTGLRTVLEVSVEMPEVKNDPEFSETLKNIYGEEFYNEIHND